MVERFIRIVEGAGYGGGRKFSIEFGDQSWVREFRVWHLPVESQTSRAAYQARYPDIAIPEPRGIDEAGSLWPAIGAIQLVWEREDGVTVTSPIVGSPPVDARGEPGPWDDDIRLGEDDVINGYFMTTCWGRVSSIGLYDQRGRLGPLGTDIGDRSDIPLDQTIVNRGGTSKEQETALVAGFTGRYDDDGIIDLGLLVTVEGPAPSPAFPDADSGRVISVYDMGEHPMRDEGNAPLTPRELEAGRDPSSPCSRFRRVRPYELSIDYDRLHVRTVDGRTTTWRFDRAAWDAQQRRPVDYYAESSGDKERMRLYPPTSTRRLRVEGAGEGTGTVAPLVPPTTPPLPDGESPRWDNVFSADHRPTYLQFIFCGLNIAKLNPADLQSPTGAVRDQVFLSPSSASGYHMAATSRFLVPNGWRIGLDRTGSTSTRTVAANSEQEIQKTWSTNLGFSADADAMGAELAFSHNESAQHELNKSTSEATSSTLSDAVTCDHYVVIDLATVALHPGFKAAAIDTAAAPTPARIREFIYRYGAHFVHAITFGTRSYEHRYYKSASVSARRSDGHSHEDHAKMGFHTEVMGQKTGGSLSATQGGNEQLAKAFTEGADYTTDGVTTLGNEGNPVPVMFDLEPITTLLSPVFFTDPLVYRDLRPTVEQMIREHGSSILGAVAPSGS